MRIPSSVERYRAGEINEVPYDLRDPYDRAIWTALELYSDFLERLAIETKQETNLYELSEGMQRNLRFRQAWELEEAMKDLKSVVRDGRKMDAGELRETVQSVIEALLAPERWGVDEQERRHSYVFDLPEEFWERGGRDLREDPEESPLFLDETLAPVAQLVRQGYEIATGESVSQSEAARRLGISHTMVAKMIDRGDLRAIRVGRNILVPAKELSDD